MRKYTGELKGSPRSVRFTDAELQQINLFKGESFNEKLSSLIAFASGHDIEEINGITDEIDMLYAQRQKLISDMQKLEEGKRLMDASLDSLQRMEKAFNGDTLESEKRIGQLRRSIREAGYHASRNVLQNITSLDRLMGKEHTMEDICKAYKQQGYASVPEAQELADKIGREFQIQEYDRIPELTTE